MQIKVEMINKEDFKDNSFFRKWGEFSAICYDTPLSKAVGIGKSCLKSGHFSGARHIYFAFHIELPRSSADQIVRHEQGVVKNVQSQRYVNKSGFDFYTGSKIKANKEADYIYNLEMDRINEAYNDIINILKEDGISGEQANEQARGILPMDSESKLAIAFNVEALIHLCHKRLCTRTQEHTRKVVQLIVQEVVSVVPELEPYLVPHCGHLLWCPEGNHGKTCPRRTSGLVLSKEEVENLIKNRK